MNTNFWHDFRGTSMVGAAFLLVLLAVPGHAQTGESGATADDNTIRPFQIHVPESTLVDLRQRLAATRLPDRETVADQSQGVRLATIKELLRYWQTDYDW